VWLMCVAIDFVAGGCVFMVAEASKLGMDVW